ncbi:MAG: metalloregulator ArsR/SmtB family transcription factor [Oleiphilaceae bacterium]|nr:metalloregulator ArsR/SmtB family transcription factor [Oleiphilaceae bacterium]
MKVDQIQIEQQTVVVERYLKALSNKNRLMILCSLVDEELSVSEINRKVNLSQSALSQHLALLREDDFVDTRKVGQSVIYSIKDDKVLAPIQSFYAIFCKNI